MAKTKSNRPRAGQPAGHRPKGGPEALREVLGYLNFSSGTPDPAFQRGLGAWYASLPQKQTTVSLRDALLQGLSELEQSHAAFADTTQAEAVIRLLFDACLPAYRSHHADLLYHLSESDFLQPFFLARFFESILCTGGPWEDVGRIVQESLDRLNNFLGHRPLPVLENGGHRPKGGPMQPYAHERFRPVPLYLRDAGVAFGKYHDLIVQMFELLDETPRELLEEAYFDPAMLDELALDVRAYDHLHPMNKRTNYMFGEWDPHLIDNRGYYRRFILRRGILDFLVEWTDTCGLPRTEALYDASAVLCGTMLMASAISGAGPGTHDSSVSLTSLLPHVARQRDRFYARLLEKATGARARRLHRQADSTQQPFGHVRKELNVRLTHYGAQQVQSRQIARMYARMGFFAQARRHTAKIRSASARIECEIQWRLTSCRGHLDSGRLSDAVRKLDEIEDFLHRGIECGALPDPWTILGFQGHYPLFSAREDSVPDQRIETLLEIMDETFQLYSRALGEAAVQRQETLSKQISERFLHLAEFWDQFATTVVADLPQVAGRENWESAQGVAGALKDWREAGEAAGDISFWRRHVEGFTSATAYAHVVETLLQKQDHVAAMGLLMQWLSQAEEVGLESGKRSIHSLLVQWMNLAIAALRSTPATDQVKLWNTLKRLFAFLEANADDFWSVPVLEDVTDVEAGTDEDAFWDDEAENFPAEAGDDDEELLFEAAYDGVVYRDSADDGHFEDTLDEGYAPMNTEFEIIIRELEPRLNFLSALAELWRLAGNALAASENPRSATAFTKTQLETIKEWLASIAGFRRDLLHLMNAVHRHAISAPTGDVDSNMQFDIQLQAKFFLLQQIMNTCLEFRMAEWHLLACSDKLTVDEASPQELRTVAELCRSCLQGNTATVRKTLPVFLKSVSKRPLLYVSLENDGTPHQILSVRTLQLVIRFLLEQLPRLGLLNETWTTLNAAYKMERSSRPSGPAVTEFDRLFKTALQNTLACAIRSANHWPGTGALVNRPTESDGENHPPRFFQPLPQGVVPAKRPTQPRQPTDRSTELVPLMQEIVEHYHGLWLKYSRGIRISRVEELYEKQIWDDVVAFISRYGDELFHAGMLTLGNVRSILHTGIENFLDFLDANRDPLHPLKLLEDLDAGVIEFSHATRILEIIYECFLDKLDRFIEYNTTTTQSDYGELFYYLLDFMRVESRYERDAWKFLPYSLAHETLCRLQPGGAVTRWERLCGEQVQGLAERHLRKLHKLESAYSMQLPSVSDLLNERFVKRLSVNRMHALIPRAIEESRLGRRRSESFAQLERKIDEYLQNTAGTAFDVPGWLLDLEQTVASAVEQAILPAPVAGSLNRPVLLSRCRLLRQLEQWDRAPLLRRLKT